MNFLTVSIVFLLALMQGAGNVQNTFDKLGGWPAVFLIITNVVTLVARRDDLVRENVKALKVKHDEEKKRADTLETDLASARRELVTLYGIDIVEARELVKEITDIARIKRERDTLEKECKGLHEDLARKRFGGSEEAK